MSAAAERALGWVELGLVPDRVVRAGIRRLLAQRLQEIDADDIENAAVVFQRSDGQLGDLLASTPYL